MKKNELLKEGNPKQWNVDRICIYERQWINKHEQTFYEMKFDRDYNETNLILGKLKNMLALNEYLSAIDLEIDWPKAYLWETFKQSLCFIRFTHIIKTKECIARIRSFIAITVGKILLTYLKASLKNLPESRKVFKLKELRRGKARNVFRVNRRT